ncbi:hypothetical protein COCVIDRAFT_91568 [Bipolaris victoriae FI3]|uniref:Uncharacterized protein n=1 Tax=Bipolaris victoriae (strain FI3) TaxID=930091 RepID=W7EPC5_BIPV3|nr:hypothetical protein COCVIDRAFT_91568 [Bipolaris victoriae FI3]
MPSLLGTSLLARQNPLDDARNTFSSWDNCMAKSYCKWPVIVGIIIGGLILFSVITCIARCICCGAECACCCFRCCASCCGGGRRGSSHQRIKSDSGRPYPPQSYGPPPPQANPYAQAHAAAPPPPVFNPRLANQQQYQSNPMPTFTPAPQQERPQYATFDSSKPAANEDSLPAMPTWKEGRDVHVEVEEQPVPQKKGDMELDRLDRNGSVTSGSMGGVAAAAVPGARRSPGPGRSPVSPDYGYQQNNSFVSDAPSYNNNQGQYGQPYGQQGGYRQGSPGQGRSPVYGAGAGYGQQQQQQPYGRRSPGPSQAYGSHDQQSQQSDMHAPYQELPTSYNQPQQSYNQPQSSYNQPQSYNQSAPYNNHQDTYDQRDYPDEPTHNYSSQAPASNAYNYNASIAPSYHTYDPAPPPVQPLPSPPPQSSGPPPSLTPGRPAQTTSPVSAYPGQRSYTPAADTVAPPQQQAPPQPSYRAFTPGAETQQQSQQQQYGGVGRKPMDGSYRDI